VPPFAQRVGMGQCPVAWRKVWCWLPRSDLGWMIPNSSLDYLALQPIRHAKGYARIEKHHSQWRVGLMDGTKGLGVIY
jgi:hypothetical protein